MTLQELCQQKTNITIGYLGGSITEQKEYRQAVDALLRQAYPQTTFTDINAGVGGTNSFLGGSRAQRDLLAHKPDIVVVEFSGNDSGGYQGDFSIFGRALEGIFRKVLRQNPHALLLCFGLTAEAMNQNGYAQGKDPESVVTPRAVAEHYHVPFINAGKALYDHITARQIPIRELLPDTVHLNEAGGKFYGEQLFSVLSTHDFQCSIPTAPLYANHLEGISLLMAEAFADANWTLSHCTLYDRLPNYIYCFQPEQELTIPFRGTALGIYCTTEKDSGILCYRIDGGEWQERSTWDKYCLKFNRAHDYILAADLPDGEHTVTLKVSPQKDDLSEGYYIRIGAFLCAF